VQTTTLMCECCMQDEEGRCFTDSFLELPATAAAAAAAAVDDSEDGKKTARLTDIVDLIPS